MVKNYLAAFILTVVALAGLAAGILLVRQKQEIRERAQVTSDVLVSLSPASQTTNKGGKISVDVTLTNRTSPGRDINLQASEFTLSFDATAFSVGNLACNSRFLSQTASSNISGNSIYLACFAPGGSGGKNLTAGTSQTLASFELTALDKEGTSVINFVSAVVPDISTYTDLSGGGGVGGSYTVTGVGGGTTPPTASPTSNPTSQPTSQPTSPATKTPTPKPKGTSKATVKPTATATATATATPEIILILESPTPTSSPEEVALAEEQFDKGLIAKYVAIGAGALAVLLLLIIILKKLFGKDEDPPIANPPVSPPQTTQVPPNPINMVPQTPQPPLPPQTSPVS